MRNTKEAGRSGFTFFDYFIVVLSVLCVIIGLPISLFYCIKVIKEYERAVVFRLGKLLLRNGNANGPGLLFILPCIDYMLIIDLRTMTFDLPPQEILTNDYVNVRVDAVIHIKITDPVASIVNVENAQSSTNLLAVTTLRNILGTKSLREILQDRDTVTHQIQEILATSIVIWGVIVERVEIKDIRLPVSMQRALAIEAESSRGALAKVISAEGEKEAAVALTEAAYEISKSPIALQLRYLQTLKDIAVDKNSTIIFPLLSHVSDGVKVYSGFCFDKPCSAKNTTLESKGTIYDYYCCQNDLCNGHGHPITNTNTNRVSKTGLHDYTTGKVEFCNFSLILLLLLIVCTTAVLLGVYLCRRKVTTNNQSYSNQRVLYNQQPEQMTTPPLFQNHPQPATNAITYS